MPSLNSLLKQLRSSYPDISFVQAKDGFRWSPDEQTIYFEADAPHATAFCLHELSHAILKHQAYSRDIELITLERDAWEYARHTLGPKYKMTIDSIIAEDNLDTYRDWLHARSTCPNCQATGIQTGKRDYQCVACKHSWRVNEARTCALRRFAASA